MKRITYKEKGSNCKSIHIGTINSLMAGYGNNIKILKIEDAPTWDNSLKNYI